MRPRRSSNAERGLTGLEGLLLAVWSVVSFYVAAWIIAEKLFLVHVYGWSRVFHEHLAILHMPKHHPWPVSNGDFIDYGRTGFHTCITVLCTFASVIGFAVAQQAYRLHRALRSVDKRSIA